MKKKTCKISAKTPMRLYRDSIPEIVRTCAEPQGDKTPAWNVVQVLELLTDSGNFSLARQLAERVVLMVEKDGRERLFLAYIALCSLMIEGHQKHSIATLERLYIEINNAGHSVADKIRIGLLVARALSVCVGMGTATESHMLRVRNVLTVELDRALAAQDLDLHAQVALELSKSYLHAPTPDPRAAFALLQFAQQQLPQSGIAPELAFDIRRVLHQAAQRIGGELGKQFDENDLRSASHTLGGVARGLAELSISRANAKDNTAGLEKAATLFEENDYIAGAFEALFVLASEALDRGHNTIANRYLKRALVVAEKGGSLHGRLLVLVGLFQSALISNSRGEAISRCEELRELLSSEVAKGSMGLNLAAAQQIIGDHTGALTTAKEAMAFFSNQGLQGLQSQAAQIVGTCEGRLGRWDKAYDSWERAIELDDNRHAFLAASEKRGLLVQSIVMRDMTTLGHVKDTSATQSDKVLQQAYESLHIFGESIEARRILSRLKMVHGQLFVMRKQHVVALKHLSISRENFASLGLESDVALADALMGFCMIELGKTGIPEMLEEATMTLQRPLQHFSGPEYAQIRWKILYYLAAASYMVSQQKGAGIERLKWRDLATSWLQSAITESLSADAAVDGMQDTSMNFDFSPGLKPEVMESLKKALGLSDSPRKRKSKLDTPMEVGLDDGYVH